MHSSGRVIPSSFRRFTCFDLRFEAAVGESHGRTPASPPTSPGPPAVCTRRARTKAAYSRSTSKRPELRQHTSDRAVRVPSGFGRRAAALWKPVASASKTDPAKLIMPSAPVTTPSAVMSAATRTTSKSSLSVGVAFFDANQRAWQRNLNGDLITLSKTKFGSAVPFSLRGSGISGEWIADRSVSISSTPDCNEAPF